MEVAKTGTTCTWWCRVDASAIENHGAREAFEQAVGFGEVIAERGERLFGEFKRK